MSYPYPDDHKSSPQNYTSRNSGIRTYLPVIGVILLVFILWQSYRQQQLNQSNNISQIEARGAMRANTRNNINTYIKASTTNFNATLLGGISNLSVMVTNTSGFMMDDVVVEVDYIKADGDIYKKENVNFPYLASSSTMTVKAPDSPRGIRITYQIIKISSKALGL